MNYDNIRERWNARDARYAKAYFGRATEAPHFLRFTMFMQHMRRCEAAGARFAEHVARVKAVQVYEWKEAA